MGKKKGIKTFVLRNEDSMKVTIKIPGTETTVEFHTGDVKIKGKFVEFEPYCIVKNVETRELSVDQMWIGIE